MISNGGDRDPFYDNLKFWVVGIFVFVGHANHNMPIWISNDATVTAWIYIWHMQLILFLSGFFSMTERNLARPFRLIENALKYCFLPFIILQSLCTVTGRVNDFFAPYIILWYLFVLGLFRVLLGIALWRIPSERFSGKAFKIHLFLLSVAVAVVMVNLTRLGDYFALRRIAYYLPFFVLGCIVSPEWMQRIRMGKLPLFVKILAGITILTSLTIFFVFPEIRVSPGWFTISDPLGGISYYVLGFFMVFSVLIVYPNAPNRKSYRRHAELGKYSLYFFILHYPFLCLLRWLVREWRLADPLEKLLSLIFENVRYVVQCDILRTASGCMEVRIDHPMEVAVLSLPGGHTTIALFLTTIMAYYCAIFFSSAFVRTIAQPVIEPWKWYLEYRDQKKPRTRRILQMVQRFLQKFEQFVR